MLLQLNPAFQNKLCQGLSRLPGLVSLVLSNNLKAVIALHEFAKTGIPLTGAGMSRNRLKVNDSNFFFEVIFFFPKRSLSEFGYLFFTVYFSLLYRVSLRSSLGNWVLRYENCHVMSSVENEIANFEN